MNLTDSDEAVLKQVAIQLADRGRALMGGFLSVASDEEAQRDIRDVLACGGHFKIVIDLHANNVASISLVLHHPSTGEYVLSDMMLEDGGAKATSMN